MRILYFDCFSGISGDMALASLVDAGADRDYIEQELKKLKVEGYALSWRRVMKSGISALKADVLLDEETDGHAHHRHDHHHDHDHEHHHDHRHTHEHSHGHAHHHHHHRKYADIAHLIQSSELSARAKQISLDIFTKIGEAEAKIHGIPLDEVHFHEVGAVDSIVDIVGVALAIDHLHPDRILSSPVPLGSGTIHIDHGLYPVPAPATLEIMRGLPIASTPHAKELTTPTGAGIIAALVDEFCPSLPPMTVESIGYGAGTRDLPNQPNVLRTVIGTQEQRLNVWPQPIVEMIASEQEVEPHHRHQPNNQ